MKPIVIVMGLLICSLSLSAQTLQENQKEFLFNEKVKGDVINELYLSANRSLAGEDDSRWGGGIGVDHSFHLGKVVEYFLGIEYNHFSKYPTTVYSMYPYAHPPINPDYHIINSFLNLDCLTIPTGFRYNVGRKFKVFFEHGVCYDLTISSEKIEIREDKTSKKKYKNNTNYPIPSAPGFFFGIGARIPSKKVEYLVKSDIKVRFDQGEIPLILKLDVGIKWK
jgi:hypothetical protein